MADIRWCSSPVALMQSNVRLSTEPHHAHRRPSVSSSCSLILSLSCVLFDGRFSTVSDHHSGVGCFKQIWIQDPDNVACEFVDGGWYVFTPNAEVMIGLLIGSSTPGHDFSVYIRPDTFTNFPGYAKMGGSFTPTGTQIYQSPWYE